MSSPPSVIAILGSWSCGSTAVTGYIARCGAHTCPPHQRTNDPRTPDSHEPKALRDALTERINELTLKARAASDPSFRDWFADWLVAEAGNCTADRPIIVLKHALLAYFINDVQAVCAPKWLVITRPLDRIEATRRRRGWHPVYGEAGAKIIYGRIYSTLMNLSLSAPSLAFAEFQSSQAVRHRLLASLDLKPNTAQRTAAEDWLRPAGLVPDQAQRRSDLLEKPSGIA